MNISIFPPMIGRQSGGPETYDLQLIHALRALNDSHNYDVYCINQQGSNIVRESVPDVTVHTLHPGIRWISVPFVLPLHLLRRPVDIVHATYVAPPYLPSRLVFTLHDLSPFSHPHFYPTAIRFRLQKGFASSIRRASAILCASEFTRQHLAKQFPDAAEKAYVTHYGLDPAFRYIEDRAEVKRCLERYGIPEPYLLIVGKLQARKNTVRALEAFALLKKNTNLKHKLVMVGRKMWTSDEVFPQIENLGLQQDIVMTGHAPPEDIPLLYNGAAALVFPSLFEGFGFPVLEAWACGCPVVTSTATSLPEIAGDAAVLVDPYQSEAIAQGIERVLTDSGLRQELIQKGFERVQQFTWKRTAEQVLRIYEAVAGQNEFPNASR
jgi:glycosyltransferase involved in cell wall biosynthesis